MASSANLGQQLENYVNELVKSGRYNSRSEVPREGVRLVEEREKRLMALDLAISQGIADAEAGSFKPISDFAARLAAKYDGRS
ncbi:type II toxin-antitoxin system ParD family antitoxin [Rhizobium leguminosarum]|uniref:type II toxin-antitoxin system ParD family antitoxin n=1 Tax=Rhizobium leguminosarum TaxID=384 RepID=UPI0014425540|nr:type II toxin-antitoxin system ParD family antitoxin [Rhizobium leguminosarum]MBY5866218.1 type II toxin-antitoxin system ParD family antitoxin [Rhizobium leguminosarum]NKM08149.1 type II toxin-antitoxin system ParD family antitoxin [Rhizobium leguminosarum bv. viciae]